MKTLLFSNKKRVVCAGFAVRADFVPTRAFISSSTRFLFLIQLNSHEGSDNTTHRF